MRPNRSKLIVCLLLVLATISVFWQVRNHDFVNYDDHKYVTDNRHVQAGLTWEGTTWAFTTFHASNWHPLTWLSHMLDCQIYGLNAGGHHLTNLLFHLTNTLLLFLILNRMTGALWRSAFVAAIFALHPLHVESVAWVAERKDVLSTFFWMLTMWAYIRYAERPGGKTYLLVVLFFALGLMAKPMLVTLPFVLLLMDYWPLGRLRLGQSNKDRWLNIKETPAIRLIWEKVPLFALTAVSSVVTFYAQQAGGSVAALDKLPLNARIANGLVSYVSYTGKMIWPSQLAVFYPHEDMVALWQAAGAGLLLACISILVICVARRFQSLAVGWLWYLGTLVPVIGIIQVGEQAMADRYTYVPLIGLFIMIAWGVGDLAARWHYRRIILSTFTGILLLVLMTGTWLQIRHWQNSITLFEHALDVTTNNFVAHYNLGEALEDNGRLEEAIGHFHKALQIKPNNAKAYYSIGTVYGKLGNYKKALSVLKQAIFLKPDYAEAYTNLGAVYGGMNLYSKAVWALKEAVRLNPDDKVAQQNLKIAYEIIKKQKIGIGD
ncbi:MAG: tetratricopeptide repeat protein [Deltaproteobacteria bacterium]|nr:tetratricopeptide repeat protein [Deltaproteobacteria bacterium]